jgi:hypothetical protein
LGEGERRGAGRKERGAEEEDEVDEDEVEDEIKGRGRRRRSSKVYAGEGGRMSMYPCMDLFAGATERKIAPPPNTHAEPLSLSPSLSLSLSLSPFLSLSLSLSLSLRPWLQQWLRRIKASRQADRGDGGACARQQQQVVWSCFL